jgi:putative sigma-54 modulation protein
MIDRGGKKMDMQISGKNIEVVPAVRDYITRKLGKINRHLPYIMAFDVVATEEKTRSPDQRFVMQVTINNKGTLLRAEVRGQDLYSATDKVTELMNRQIEHYKSRKPSIKGRGGPSIRTSTTEATSAVDSESEESATEEPGPKVVKSKHFEIKPMSVEEAIDQMILLGHDFFLFYNQDSNNMNLVYRRKDGNYGLIEATTK